MLKPEKSGNQPRPTPDQIRALERIERLNRLTQKINEWVLHYHHKDEEFCELFEFMANCTDLAFTQIEAKILPFTDDELLDPAERENRISHL